MTAWQVLVVGPDGKDPQEVTVQAASIDGAHDEAARWCREETSGWTVQGVVL